MSFLDNLKEKLRSIGRGNRDDEVSEDDVENGSRITSAPDSNPSSSDFSPAPLFSDRVRQTIRDGFRPNENFHNRDAALTGRQANTDILGGTPDPTQSSGGWLSFTQPSEHGQINEGSVSFLDSSTTSLTGANLSANGGEPSSFSGSSILGESQPTTSSRLTGGFLGDQPPEKTGPLF